MGFGFRASGFVFRFSCFRFRVSGFGFRVSGFGLRASGFGFRVDQGGDGEEGQVAGRVSGFGETGGDFSGFGETGGVSGFRIYQGGDGEEGQVAEGDHHHSGVPRNHGPLHHLCSHVTALEPIDCLRENKRNQLTALSVGTPLCGVADRRVYALPNSGSFTTPEFPASTGLCITCR